MSMLSHIKVGDTVRLHGDRFAQGHVEGEVTDAFRHDLFRVEGVNWPSEGVLYETVTGVRALLGGIVYRLSCVEVVRPCNIRVDLGDGGSVTTDMCEDEECAR